ncbi:MarC family protein [Denitrobaculum tricleocarpae]|uniref:UPF0056 membrane protein n=1 Tax=Denitrobaculum tricleocarpae TaxID=2591009 RepID=A0A545TF21_9PROT|nr:MarC family protein [Denitrobaculum tricleocarpae]TQV75800.1 NAAT family transporter [Denitrobaculum tricleocarpae]
MGEAALSTFVAALFSMMNPIGNVGIFVGMTTDRDAAEVRKIAWKCALACAVTLLTVIWTGGLLLTFFGITVDELRAAGGIIVMLIGLHMLFNKSGHKTSATETDDAKTRDSIAVVPLAIPIVAGPGTIATVLVAAERHPGLMARVDISLAVILLSILTGLLFAYSKPVAAWLGESGMAVVTRIMGMVLVAIAMGMLASGLTGLIPALAG